MPAHTRQHDLAAPLDGTRKKCALTLLANMIVTSEQVAQGVISRVKEQGRYRLMPEMLSRTEMPFERMLLRVIYSMEVDKIPATQDNLLKRMTFDFEDAADRLQTLAKYRTADSDVSTFAFAIGDWIERQRLLMAVEQAAAYLRRDVGNIQEAYNEVMQILTEVAPRSKPSTVRDGIQMRELFEQTQRERRERWLKGISAGPTWPWKAFREKVPNFKIGEMALLMAESKHGKSTIGLLLAEHAAYGPVSMRDHKTWPKFDTYEQEDGYYDVLLLHMETTHDSFNDRIMARHLLVTPADLRDPTVVDIRKDPWKTRYEKTEKLLNACENTRGKIHYDHCPGITPSELQAKVANHKALATARGRELVVIVDYYTEIDWTRLARDQTTGNNALADFLKNVAEQEQVYLWVFAQYNIDADKNTKRTAWNGSKIVMRSQVVVRLERAVAKDDAAFSPGGRQIMDGLNRPIYLHRAGEPHSDATLNILFANDDQAGLVGVTFINGYFDVLDK